MCFSPAILTLVATNLFCAAKRGMLKVLQRLKSLNPKCTLLMASSKSFSVAATEPETLFHEIEDKKSGKVRRIAYKKINGPCPQGLIYIPGFMSNKSGIKATTLQSFCLKYGFSYVRYDPSGLGESEGVPITETRLSLWLEDATEMLLKMSHGPQVVIASSMGCWISCLLAKKYPEKFKSIIMLAPGINSGEKLEKKLHSQLLPEDLKKYEDGETLNLCNPEYGDFPVCKMMFEDMKQFNLTLAPEGVTVTCPVRIIHGLQDKDVPYKESLELLHALKTDDAQLIYLKHADHRLKDDASLEVICDTVLKLASHEHPEAI